jgi:hypothetical protein
MQAVHEFGHMLGAWITGGRVAQVVLLPLTISHTELVENPHPLAVVWCGPVGGVVFPLLAWTIANRCGWRGDYLLRFFAGFCLIANGAYIGMGVFDPVGDAVEMLRLGSPAWLLGAFGAATVLVGLWLWHRQGEHFGFGAPQGKVSCRAVYASALALILLVALELLFGGE